MKLQNRVQKKTINIVEIFESLQGEGRYAGTPMLFIRLGGCNRRCWFCDTKYSWTDYKPYSIDKIVKIVKKSKLNNVCFTGGEPLLQFNAIREIKNQVKDSKTFHLETNGDLINNRNVQQLFKVFKYVACSPKELATAQKVHDLLSGYSKEIYDIKVVTDLKKEGVDMIKYATILMPLTFYDKRDKMILKKVWWYCTKHNIRFSPRLQFFIFGKKKKI